MGHQRKYNAASIKNAIDSGMSVNETADHLGIPARTLWRYAGQMKKTYRSKRSDKRRTPLLEAIANGVETSCALAEMFQVPRPRMSVRLTRLADLGLVQRASAQSNGKGGRPCVRWRVVKAKGEA